MDKIAAAVQQLVTARNALREAIADSLMNDPSLPTDIPNAMLPALALVHETDDALEAFYNDTAFRDLSAKGLLC